MDKKIINNSINLKEGNTIMKKRSGWLPKNRMDELNIALALIKYAQKETTYDLSGFAYSKDLHPSDIKGISQISTGTLPNVCKIAMQLVEKRQNRTDSFFAFSWKDTNGKYWQELQRNVHVS